MTKSQNKVSVTPFTQRVRLTSHPPYTVDGEAICSLLHYCWDFRGSSVGKESARNGGDPVLIAGSESSPGEGIGYPLQYSWISLVAQLVKNLPAMWETWVYKHVCV